MNWKAAAWSVWAIALVVLALSVCIAAFYVVPTLIETQLAALGGPVLLVLVLGDLLGCVAIGALAGWRRGAGLYLLLTGVEIALYLTGAMPSAAVPWLEDSVPTLILCALLLYVARPVPLSAVEDYTPTTPA